MSDERPQQSPGERRPEYPGRGPDQSPEQEPDRGQGHGEASGGSAAQPSSPPPAYPPPPGQHGQPPYGQGGQYGQPQYGQQYGQPQYGAPPPAYGSGPVSRPGKVLAAAIVTWVFAGLSMIPFVALLIGALSDSDFFLDEVVAQTDGQITRQDARVALISVAVVFLFWCVCAIVLAFLTLQRQNWARITLAVSAGFTALFSLLGITSVLPVLTLGAAVAVIVLLFTSDSNAWFRDSRAGGRTSYQQPPQPPSSAW